jgi:SAM-dependent methyltransferase
MPRLVLPPRGLLSPNNAVDPLRYYYHPLVGILFRQRLQIGLDLLPGRCRRLLEVGYGSGLLLPTLAQTTDELYGIDREPAPPGLRDQLAQLGCAPRELVAADVTAMPFADGYFDAVVAFSIFEHLREPELRRALAEVARVLGRGGYLLVGCPAVHRLMNAGFAAIGFRGIEDHHVSSMHDVLRLAAPRFRCAAAATLPPLPRALSQRAALSLAMYSAVRLELQ